ncbi:MAG: TetR/AcrR family transcriptional regulator [Eggerthellaceae bacterium]|nr:TetR/AcrR family transcriptional regulator [Eggerthellaceae bacterium]
MARTEEPKRNSRTRRDIKQAMLKLLAHKSRDEITMSELAREAQVSRSTLYQHYGNVYDAYADIVNGFADEVTPVMSEAACFDGIEPEGTVPFCNLVRAEKYRSITDTPCFLETYMGTFERIGNHEFLKILTNAGYSPEVAEAVAVFQMNGCFKAVKRYGNDEETWREVRDAIDTFICGGLEACRQKKLHQKSGK